MLEQAEKINYQILENREHPSSNFSIKSVIDTAKKAISESYKTEPAVSYRVKVISERAEERLSRGLG